MKYTIDIGSINGKEFNYYLDQWVALSRASNTASLIVGIIFCAIAVFSALGMVYVVKKTEESYDGVWFIVLLCLLIIFGMVGACVVPVSGYYLHMLNVNPVGMFLDSIGG